MIKSCEVCNPLSLLLTPVVQTVERLKDRPKCLKVVSSQQLNLIRKSRYCKPNRIGLPFVNQNTNGEACLQMLLKFYDWEVLYSFREVEFIIWALNKLKLEAFIC